eukprot:TRINITY_DN22180_c0_g1_i1.p2 TRINITY_DN22180_c0_g1~~TRINITY_DN22180_c0_g1_i1.p2  ORF type:complete len:127 (+),score=63.37 TRINITY_DN22180_c0_g1_i1:53-382(+)
MVVGIEGEEEGEGGLSLGEHLERAVLEKDSAKVRVVVEKVVNETIIDVGETEGLRGRVRLLEGRVEDLERLVKMLTEEVVGLRNSKPEGVVVVREDEGGVVEMSRAGFS